MTLHARTILAVALFACAGCAGSDGESTSSATSATIVCGQTTIHGMDVSHYDGAINWATAKSSGIDFAFVKATEGTTFVDPTFATNWTGMKSAGVVRGAYHFFHANVDPHAQASFVVQTVGQLEAGDLPLVIDLETTDGQSAATVAANALAFLDAVKTATGKKPIVYVSPGFMNGSAANASGFASYSLWVANWGVSCPDVPSPWAGWAFWQHSATGTVPGVPASAVDLDTFNGTLADLHAFGGGTIVSDAGVVTDAGGGHADGGTSSGDGGNAADSGGSTHDDSGTNAGNDAGTRGDGGSLESDAGGAAVFADASASAGCSVAAQRPWPTKDTVLWLVAIAAALAMRRRRAA